MSNLVFTNKCIHLDPNRLPTRFEDWEKQARRILADGPYDYVAGGSGAEDTVQTNRDSFKRWHIVPRVLRHVEDRNLKVALYGHMYSSPVMVAPIGVQSIIHEEGELASARAAASMGVPYIASSASSHSMEEIAEVMGDSPKWFQLYWSRDPAIARSFVERAELAGYSAIVVTLDTPMMAWRELDLQNVYLPFLIGEGIGNYLTDPAFRSGLHTPSRRRCSRGDHALDPRFWKRRINVGRSNRIKNIYKSTYYSKRSPSSR